MMGATNTFACPIIQALAPCRSVGCCAVYELVSRALFMAHLVVDHKSYYSSS